MQAFPIVMNFLVLPIFFLSGALFPLDTSPKALQIISAFDPLSYGVDGMRGALVGHSHYGPLVDIDRVVLRGHRAVVHRRMAILEDRDLAASEANDADTMPKGLSQRAHQKVLETAAELFADRGIDTTSMDAIAAKSGVSKATIYKHWSDKEALCMEVMIYLQRLDEGPPKTGQWRLESRHGGVSDLRSAAAH